MCDEVRGCRVLRGIFTEYVRYLTGRQQKPKRFFGVRILNLRSGENFEFRNIRILFGGNVLKRRALKPIFSCKKRNARKRVRVCNCGKLIPDKNGKSRRAPSFKIEKF